ncbi:MAG: hypothetical protein J6Y57_00580 [Lachnospiraceae bacterium]|nr:hypothetical protein [Lachnospiraceae bacterium]
MKHILVIVAGIAVYFLVRLKKTYRTQILLVFLGVLACVSLVFTCVNIGGTVTLTGSKNQLIHQPSFVRDGIYPDTILPLMVAGKTVYTKDDIKQYEYDMNDPSAPWEDRLWDVHYGHNSRNLLAVMGAKTVADAGLNDCRIPDEMRERFTDLGYANDMYRFSFAVNDIPYEYGNFFHYYTIYTVDGNPVHVYLAAKDADAFLPGKENELVALWQRDRYCEDLYLMDRETFDEEVGR